MNSIFNSPLCFLYTNWLSCKANQHLFQVLKAFDVLLKDIPLYKVLDHVLEVAQSLNLSRKYAYSPSVSPVCRTVIAFLQPGTNQKTMIQNVFKWPPNCKEYKTTCFLHTTVPHKSQISCCINFAGWCFSLFLTFTIKFMIQTMNSSRQKFGTNVKKKLLNTKCKTTLNSNKIHSFKQMITCYENQILCW